MLSPDQGVILIPNISDPSKNRICVSCGLTISIGDIQKIVSTLTPLDSVPSAVEQHTTLTNNVATDNAIVMTTYKELLTLKDQKQWSLFFNISNSDNKIILIPLSFWVGDKNASIQVSRQYGTVTFSGPLDGVKATLTPHHTVPQYTAQQEAIWPRDDEDRSFFTREEIPSVTESCCSEKGVLVAKETALPSSWTLRNAHAVWVPALETWKRLVSRGVWVNGSFDGLGEREGFGEIFSKLSWIKLTHDAAPSLEGIPSIATYSLIPNAFDEDLSQKRFFFWRSGTLFLSALERFPSIRNARHASGPGNTHTILQKYIDARRLDIFLSHAAWRENFYNQKQVGISA